MSDEQAWPSLILATHENAHREHLHQHLNTHEQHQHQHYLFHRGVESGETATAVQSVVTQVTATISLIQEVDIDTNGSTFAIQTVLADSTQGTAGQTSKTPAANTVTTTPTDTALVSAASVVGTTSSSAILPTYPTVSQTSNTTSSTRITSSSTLSPADFSSIIASSNSTTLISTSIPSSSSNTQSFSNSSTSTTTSTFSSSSSLISSTSSSSSSSESSSTSTSSTSSIYSPTSSSSVFASSTVGGIAGGTAANTGSAATSSATSASGNGSSSNTPSTPVVVGGVVGSIAGAAILIFLLLAFVRWKKRHQSMLQLGSGNEPSDAVTSRDAPFPNDAPRGMAERSMGFVPAALASLTGFTNRSSRQTMSSTAESERGFVRVSGRKLPSVLQNGGDGYGGGIKEQNTLSGSSFYRDSQGFYGGTGAGTGGPLGVVAGTANTRDSGVPVMRPSPARTPITQPGPFSAQQPSALTPPPRPDLLGRSRPSQDGSQRSRFTEEV